MCCLFCVKAVPRDLLLCANTAEMLVHKLRSGTPGGTHAQASKTRKIQIQLVCFERHPEKVRRRLRALIEKARSAEKMPWSERDARTWQIVFPNMAKWLPDHEAEQLRFEFAQEMERLKQAA